MSILNDLKQENEDFEWYPTTEEILSSMKEDIKTIAGDTYNRYINGVKKEFKDGEWNYYIIESFLDIGAGDGRVFNFLGEEGFIKNKVAIEKAQYHADNLLKNKIFLLGRDFFKVTLIDKRYNIIFSNPPYSIYEEWVEKILIEANADIIYLVIPDRWQNNNRIKDLIKQRGKFFNLGTFTFEDADRVARCTTNLIRIEINSKFDTFSKWIEDTIDPFDIKKIDSYLEEDQTIKKDSLQANSSDKIFKLVENYNSDLENLINLYKSLSKIPYKLLAALNISQSNVFDKIKDDIKSLKQKYWNIAFTYLEPIQKRLTYKSREKYLSSIQKFGGIDFNEDNIYNIILWVIENFNDNSSEQIIQLFDDLTAFEGFTAYKSNTVWEKSGWRYNNKDFPEKYKLEYRIVTRMYEREYDLHWSLTRKNTLIHDILVVAESLGFIPKNQEIELTKDGKLYTIYTIDDEELFTYRYYKNGNAHIKMNKDFLLKFNIEVGKMKGWLSKPSDIQEEFDLTIEDSIKFFQNSQINYLNKNILLLE